MSDEPAQALRSDPLAFLDELDGSLERISSGHAIAFAAVLAERRIADAGEDEFYAASSGSTVRKVMDEVWEQVCGRPIERDRFRAIEEDLEQIALLVDPDRYTAYRSYNAIRLIRAAVRCSEGDNGAGGGGSRVGDGNDRGAVAAGRASLHMAASSMFADDYENDRNLRKMWSRKEVQQELDLQRRLSDTLRAMRSIGREEIVRLRAEFAAS